MTRNTVVLDQPISGSPAHRLTGSQTYVGVLIFLAAEAMLFAGLISAYLVIRSSQVVWPPPGQPRYPVGVTALNTLVLLFSGFAMAAANRSAHAADLARLRRWLTVAGAAAVIFLVIQGVEWARLIGHGLTLTSHLYGAIFYVVIGGHAVHVLAAVIILLAVSRKVWRTHSTQNIRSVMEGTRLYWYFVVGLWPILYVLVYLI